MCVERRGCCVAEFVCISTSTFSETWKPFCCSFMSCNSSYLTRIVFTWVLGTLRYFNKGTQAPGSACCSTQYCFSVSQYLFCYAICANVSCLLHSRSRFILVQFCKACIELDVFDVSVAVEMHIPSRLYTSCQRK